MQPRDSINGSFIEMKCDKAKRNWMYYSHYDTHNFVLGSTRQFPHTVNSQKLHLDAFVLFLYFITRQKKREKKDAFVSKQTLFVPVRIPALDISIDIIPKQSTNRFFFLNFYFKNRFGKREHKQELWNLEAFTPPLDKKKLVRNIIQCSRTTVLKWEKPSAAHLYKKKLGGNRMNTTSELLYSGV